MSDGHQRDGQARMNQPQVSLLERLHSDRIHALVLPLKDHSTVGRRQTWQRVLSHYLSCRPADLPIHYSATGKPELLNSPLDFSISHTQHLLVALFSLEGPVGIDLESSHRRLPWKKLAARFFASEEAAFLAAAASEDEMRRTFLQFWTRKEAFVKATGEGIADQLKHFRVDQEQLQRLVNEEWLESQDWSLQTLDLGTDWICSAALPRSWADHKIPIILGDQCPELKT